MTLLNISHVERVIGTVIAFTIARINPNRGRRILQAGDSVYYYGDVAGSTQTKGRRDFYLAGTYKYSSTIYDKDMLSCIGLNLTNYSLNSFWLNIIYKYQEEVSTLKHSRSSIAEDVVQLNLEIENLQGKAETVDGLNESYQVNLVFYPLWKDRRLLILYFLEAQNILLIFIIASWLCCI